MLVGATQSRDLQWAQKCGKHQNLSEFKLSHFPAETSPTILMSGHWKSGGLGEATVRPGKLLSARLGAPSRLGVQAQASANAESTVPG